MDADTKALTISPTSFSLLPKNVQEITLFDNYYHLFIFSYFNLYTVNVPRLPGKVLQCLATATWNDL